MQTTDRPTRRTGWEVLVRWTAYADIALFVAAAIGLRDKEAGASAVALVVGLVLLRLAHGTIGKIVLGLLFANFAAWDVLAGLSNLAHGESFLHSMLPSLLAVLSLCGLVSTIVSLFPRRDLTARIRGPRNLAVASLAVIAAALVVTFVGPSPTRATAGDTKIVTKDTKFVPSRIEVKAGRVSVFMSNEDLFWHTFTIRKLHVSLDEPVGGHRRASFDAPPGTYEFVCLIHEQAGMKGTLIVE
jgi:plastocyanin